MLRYLSKCAMKYNFHGLMLYKKENFFALYLFNLNKTILLDVTTW